MEVVAPAPIDAAQSASAANLSTRVRLGTSSWSFPGWRGLVYAPKAPVASLASAGLAAYAHHPLHRTVGLDRSFYETPTERTYADLATLVPADFRFVVKAHQACTRPNLQADGTTRGDVAAAREHGAANARFMDAAWATDHVITPAVNGLGTRCGPILFQFPALTLGAREAITDARHLLDRLHAFVSALPRGPRYAVEVRNEALFRGDACAQFAALLRDTGVVPGLGLIPTMPSAAVQARRLHDAGWDPSRAPCLLVRWLLGHHLGYQEAKDRFEPFDTLAAPDASSRAEIAALVAACTAAGGESFVIINNKAEGSAPRSIPLLAESIRAVQAKIVEPQPTPIQS